MVTVSLRLSLVLRYHVEVKVRYTKTQELLKEHPIQMCVCVHSLCTCVWLFVTPWTVAHQAPLSMGFSRQEYWSGLPCPPPGDLPKPGIEPGSLMSPALVADSLPLVPPGKPIDTYDSSNNEVVMMLYWLCQSLWLCGSQQTVENYSRDGNTRPPDLPLEKSVCRSGSSS